jgi:hypothetical protein
VKVMKQNSPKGWHHAERQQLSRGVGVLLLLGSMVMQTMSGAAAGQQGL